MGMDVPEGFQFTGDLEADLERLDALQEREASSGSGATVPAHVVLAVCSGCLIHMCNGIACCAQSDSESGGSAASSARSPIVPAAAVAMTLPTSSLRASSMLIPKLDMDEAPRDCSDQAADADSLHRSAESGGSTADFVPASQRQGSRALSAMEGATFAIGKMQAVHRPSQVMGASWVGREQCYWAGRNFRTPHVCSGHLHLPR